MARLKTDPPLSPMKMNDILFTFLPLPVAPNPFTCPVFPVLGFLISKRPFLFTRMTVITQCFLVSPEANSRLSLWYHLAISRQSKVVPFLQKACLKARGAISPNSGKQLRNILTYHQNGSSAFFRPFSGLHVLTPTDRFPVLL